MADVKISALPSVTVLAANDEFPVVDTDVLATKRVTLANIAASFANVTNFLVPDGNADGEAIAYDQANWRLAGGTFTGNVNVSSTLPRVIVTDTDGTVDNRKADFVVLTNEAYLRARTDADAANYTIIRARMDTKAFDLSTNTGGVTVPDATADGQALAYLQPDAAVANLDVGTPAASKVNILTITNTGYIQKDDATQIRFDPSGAVVLAPAGTVIVPAISGTGQAAQVTAYDATTGRLAIGGVEMGSTGWRDISSLLTNGWAATSGAAVYMKRTGNTVHIGGRLDGSAQTNAQFYTLPSGFQAGVSDASTFVGITGGTTVSAGYMSSTTSLFLNSSLTGIRFGFSFQAQTTWPASLPGTQTTAPFS